MIAWPIDVAAASGLFDQIVVSTDDDEVLQVAMQAGATHAIQRSANLADDFTPLRPVINDAIVQVEKAFGQQVTYACSILPTAILMRAEDLSSGYEAVCECNFQFAFAAATFISPIQRALRRGERGGVAMMYPDYRLTRSQDLEEAFHDAGQFYWGQREAFLENRPMYGDASKPIMIPRQNVCDIDTPEDLEHAERLLALLYNGSSSQA